MPTWNVRFDLFMDLRDEELLKATSEARALAKVVHGIPLQPRTRARIDQLNIMRAVRGTTGIEGSDLTEGEVEQVLSTPDDGPVLPRGRAREEREVRNAERVMRFVMSALESDPAQSLSEDLIRELHRLMTEGIPYEHNDPGHYRSHAVTALDYTPPRDPDEVRRLMSEFVDWLNQPPVTKWPEVARAIAAHFYFISIHPFGDGNGRTARAIESYLLYQSGINKLGFFSLANFYYRHRPDYIRMLDFVRFHSKGNLTPFVTWAACGLTEELEIICDDVLQANKQVSFRDYVRDFFDHAHEMQDRTRERLGSLMINIIQSPEEISVVDIRKGKHRLAVLYRGLSPRTLQRDLRMLEEEEMIYRDGDMIRANYELMDRFRTA